MVALPNVVALPNEVELLLPAESFSPGTGWEIWTDKDLFTEIRKSSLSHENVALERRSGEKLRELP